VSRGRNHHGRRPYWSLSVGLLLTAGCAEDSVEEVLEGPSGGYVRTAAVARGRQLYELHGCNQCHGPEGRGDGPIADHLQPPPRDFHDRQQFRHGYQVAQIESTIRRGIVTDRRLMPAYGHLTAGDLTSLAVYIRSLSEVEDEAEVEETPVGEE
jgi:mono/diheme cytochrome c family protein